MQAQGVGQVLYQYNTPDVYYHFIVLEMMHLAWLYLSFKTSNFKLTWIIRIIICVLCNICKTNDLLVLLDVHPKTLCSFLLDLTHSPASLGWTSVLTVHRN